MAFNLKGLFLEEVDNESVDLEPLTSYEENNVKTQITEFVEDISENLIDEIYSKNDLFDKTKSIFKVEELIKSLPKEMSTETKRATVTAILTSFGLTITDMIEDGDKRISTIIDVLGNITTNGNSEIKTKELKIEDLKKEISQLEKEISEINEELKLSDEKITAEQDRITKLIKFVGGVE